jgi:hypothetical protein
MILSDFIGKHSPRCFRFVCGIIDNGNFVVTGNSPFTFPLRHKYGKIIELAVIGMDTWVGKIFEKPTMRDKPTGNRKRFFFGSEK